MTLSYVICTTKRSHWPACNSTMTGRLRSYIEACASSSHATETKPSELSTDRSVRCTAFRGRQFFFLYRTSEWCPHFMFFFCRWHIEVGPIDPQRNTSPIKRRPETCRMASTFRTHSSRHMGESMSLRMTLNSSSACGHTPANGSSDQTLPGVSSHKLCATICSYLTTIVGMSSTRIQYRHCTMCTILRWIRFPGSTRGSTQKSVQASAMSCR